MGKKEDQSLIKDFFEHFYNLLEQKDEAYITLPGIEKEMWADHVNPKEEWKKWKLISSNISEERLDQLEDEIGIKFPSIFRIFLSTYFHLFDDPIGRNSFSEPFEAVYHAWNPMLVKSGYLPFACDEEGYFIRCIKLDAMPIEEECAIYQIDHELLFDFDEEEVTKDDIDSVMEYVSKNFVTYLKEQMESFV